MQLFSREQKSIHSNLPSARALYARRITHDPYIDWEVLIVLTFMLLIVVVGLGAWLYYTTEERLYQSDKILEAKRIPFNVTVSDGLLEKFDKKAVDRAAMLKSGYTGPGDPSL